jgi:adenylate cyclase
MGQEIERKFLVTGDSWRSEVENQVRIEQGYLSSNAKATVRVRLMGDDKALITIKGAVSGLKRAEYEYDIPVADGRELLEMSRPHTVTKTRHHVRHGEHLWEIDVFDGAHQGLVIAEVEMEAEDQHVEIPDWAGKEVTEDDRYANASLSRVPGVPEP